MQDIAVTQSRTWPTEAPDLHKHAKLLVICTGLVGI